MEAIDQVLFDFYQFGFPTTESPELSPEQETTLDSIITDLSSLSDTITTEQYHHVLSYLKKIPRSYFQYIKEEVIKAIILNLDKGNVKGPLKLFRIDSYNDALEIITGLNSALNVYILKTTLELDDSNQT